MIIILYSKNGLKKYNEVKNTPDYFSEKTPCIHFENVFDEDQPGVFKQKQSDITHICVPSYNVNKGDTFEYVVNKMNQ